MPEDHVKSITQTNVPLSRRGFVASSVVAGYALAAQPIQAQTAIQTPATGLVVGNVTIGTTSGTIGAYRAKQNNTLRKPIVLVDMEVFGLHEYIRDVCRRLARSGFLAIAPDTFARQGDLTKAADIPAAIAIVSKKSDEELMSDLDATARWAANADDGDDRRVFITGFCRGGRSVWLYAAHSKTLKAGVAWYGPLTPNTNPNMPKTPVEVAPQLNAPVLGLYGGADQGIPIESVDKMRTAIRTANKMAEIHVYPDTPHGFHADFRPTYRKEAAEDGWQRMLEWFRRHGAQIA